MNRLIDNITAPLFLLAALALQGSMASGHAPSSSLTLASPTLEISFPTKQTLIHFFYVPQPEEDPNIEIHLSYRSNSYVRTAHLETIEPEGRPAEIETVFTLDADGDRERELFIVAKWSINHSAIGTTGTYYKVYVYRKSASNEKEWEFHRARDIEDRLGSGLSGTQEGNAVSFPYSDYASIRDALRP